MSGVLLVPDLALEHWPSMDRYAAELARRISVASVPPEAQALRGPRYLTRYLRYPRSLLNYSPALVHVADHSYGHCLSAFPSLPSVVTIHDLYPLHVISYLAGSPRAATRNLLLRWVLGWVRRASRWIAVSESTAAEARRHLDLPADRIRVVPNGVAETFFARPPDGAVAQRRRGWLGADATRGRFVILHVGNCSPRKNVEAAIQALGILRRRGIEAMLVQIGGRFESRHRRAVAAAGVEALVVQETAVTEESLLEAYHAADVLVLPSTYEGFGMPVLEAQAAGLPVAISGAAALVETAGGGALVAGTEPATLAEALGRILTDTTTRTTLVQRGLLHARTMTWDAAAQQVRKVYDELLPNP